MNLLSIGNSFSVDAHHYLHDLAKSAGEELNCYNLYIGGCSLETHWNNYSDAAPAYDLYINAVPGDKISIQDALALKEWDVITLQQASHFSGQWETYQPYLSDLARCISCICPKARLFIHETWAYEIDAVHPDFVKYDRDQGKMYQMLRSAYSQAADTIKASLIPVGDVIQLLRNTSITFDYRRGGLSLCRDGFHLSLLYGRYAAALTWLETLLPGSIDKVSFLPKVEGEITIRDFLKTIETAVRISTSAR